MPTSISVADHEVRILEGSYLIDGSPSPTATKFAQKLIAGLPKMKQAAVRDLLETFNDVWAEDDESELTAAAFAANLVDPQITIYDELGAASIYFGDSDMFGGHLVSVSVNDHKIQDATIAG